jgi:hypothetical protein
VKSIQKTWDGFLSPKVYFYSGTVPHAEIKVSSGVVIRVYSRDDRKDLFELYKVCCSEDWYSFLEINEKNFLDRFIDQMSPRGLLSSFVKKKILIAAEGKVAKAYVIIVGNRFRQKARVFFLFLPPGVSPYVAESLITNALNDPFITGATQLTIYSVVTNDAPLDQILPEIASKRQIHMIPKKTLG